MLLNQLRLVGKVCKDLDGANPYYEAIHGAKKYPEAHVIVMDVDIEKVLASKSPAEAIRLQQQDYQEYLIASYMIDMPPGTGLNETPVILWFPGKADEDAGSLRDSRLAKVRNAATLNLRTAKALQAGNDQELTRDDLEWYVAYLQWVLNNEDPILDIIEGFMASSDLARKKVTIIPRFTFKDGETHWPGELEIVREVYLRNKTPSEKDVAMLVCTACGKRGPSPLKAAKANITMWSTLEQMSHWMLFFSKKEAASSLCTECIAQVSQGLVFCKEFGKKFKLGFALMEGNKPSKIQLLAVPMARDESFLRGFITHIRTMNPRAMFDDVDEIESDLSLADDASGGEGDDSEEEEEEDEKGDDAEAVDLSYLMDDEEIIRSGVSLLHFIKEKQGGLYRLIHHTSAARAMLSRLASEKHAVESAHGIKALKFARLYFLLGGTGQQREGGKKDKKVTTTVPMYFTCLHAMLAGKSINEATFTRTCYETLLRDVLKQNELQMKREKNEDQRDAKRALSSNIKSFKAFHDLYSKLGIMTEET